MNMMSSEETLALELDALIAEHRALDQEIERLTIARAAPELEVRRLKKRKLQLKDRITALRDRLYPDIIA